MLDSREGGYVGDSICLPGERFVMQEILYAYKERERVVMWKILYA